MPVRSDLLDEFFNDLEPKLLVRHLAAPESERHFHFHFLAKEINGMTQLHPKVVGINRRTELDFLDLIGMLVLLGFFFFFGLFVPELSKID